MVRELKHTEIGDIPVDWELQTFDETFRVISNNTLSRENLNNRGGAVRNIHYGDILTKFPEVLDCSEDEIPFVNDLSLLSSSTQLLQDVSADDETETFEKYEIYLRMLGFDPDNLPEKVSIQKKVEDFEKEVKEKFVNEPANMKLLIVVDKLLTGFDAPPCTYS